MKTLFHILTIRDHYKSMVEPGAAWYKEVSNPKYHQRFGLAAGPLNPSEYDCYVYDTIAEEPVSALAHFNSMAAASEYQKQKNAEFPPPPEPPEPPPPFPVGTYYLLEASYYEIRQLVKSGRGSVGNTIDIARKYGFEPYSFAWGWYGGQDHPSTWEEKCIAMYDDREQALAHLRRLIHK